MPAIISSAEARTIARDLLVEMGFKKQHGYIGLARLILRARGSAETVRDKAHARAIVRRFVESRASAHAVKLFEATKAKGKCWEQSKGFYSSREWRALRYQALRASDSTCKCCGAKASDGAKLHVDHIKPRSKYPELALDLDNLQVLCAECNLGKSNLEL